MSLKNNNDDGTTAERELLNVKTFNDHYRENANHK